jgi:hypothetical protein
MAPSVCPPRLGLLFLRSNRDLNLFKKEKPERNIAQGSLVGVSLGSIKQVARSWGTRDLPDRPFNQIRPKFCYPQFVLMRTRRVGVWIDAVNAKVHRRFPARTNPHLQETRVEQQSAAGV